MPKNLDLKMPFTLAKSLKNIPECHRTILPAARKQNAQRHLELASKIILTDSIYADKLLMGDVIHD